MAHPPDPSPGRDTASADAEAPAGSGDPSTARVAEVASPATTARDPGSALVPVEPEPREPGRRPGFWRRLRMRRRDDAPLGIEGAGRLRALEDRMGALELRIGERIDGLEGQLAQFWAIDERLGKLEQIEAGLGELRRTQAELVRRLERNGRALRLLAVFALLAAVAAIALVLN